jgi:hypothetical protein
MKKLHVSHFILIALFLALTVQVFNTSNLYIGFSHLPDPYKTIAGYFIGLSAEFSIFICIYAGSRSAGAWFALITFFCGILFHDHCKEVYINLDERYFHFPTAFLSSTLLQFMNSILVWFLSELFIQKRNTTEAIHNLSDLQQKHTALQQEIISRENHIEAIRESEAEVLKDKTKVLNRFEAMNTELALWSYKRDTLIQEIKTLQKKKAGASRA